MGLFDLLFGSSKKYQNVKELPSKLWLTKAAMHDGIIRDIESLRSAGVDRIVLLFHFPNVMNEMEERLQDYSTDEVFSAYGVNFDVSVAQKLRLTERTSLSILVAERHPLLEEDTRLRDVAEEFPCPSELRFYGSTEDAIIQKFVGPQMMEMLSHIGVEPDEPIESRMLNRRISQTQKKIAAQAHGNTLADSAEEWLEINCG